MPYFCSLDPEVVAISIPILAVCGGVLIAITAIIAKGRKEEQVHRERIIAMERWCPATATLLRNWRQQACGRRRAIFCALPNPLLLRRAATSLETGVRYLGRP